MEVGLAATAGTVPDGSAAPVVRFAPRHADADAAAANIPRRIRYCTRCVISTLPEEAQDGWRTSALAQFCLGLSKGVMDSAQIARASHLLSVQVSAR
jgi:hypothetical protein